MTLTENIGEHLLEAVQHNIDVITDSEWFAEFIRDSVFEVMADTEWFKELLQEAVHVELEKRNQKED